MLQRQTKICEAKLTMDELFKCLKTLRKNKSPGLDSIKADFF